MGVTCKWEYVLGKGVKRYKGHEPLEITFYGGGNSTCCMCFDNKNLYNFIIDKAHAKGWLTEEELGLEEIIVYIQEKKHIDKEAKNLAKIFIDNNIPFTYKVYTDTK